MAAHKSRYDYWKPTWKQFFFFFGVQILPILLFARRLRHDRVRALLIALVIAV